MKTLNAAQVEAVLSRRSLTVAELIEQLQDMPQEARVVFTCDYGDHCHTQQALPVGEVRGLEYGEVIAESGYSQSGYALEQTDDDGEDEADGSAARDEDDQEVAVVVLSA